MFEFRATAPVLTLFSVLFVLPSTSALDDRTQYICSSELCITDDAIDNIGEIKRHESQQDCRLSCGKHGAIWPQPTGNIQLSDERVHFNPATVRFNIKAATDATKQFVHENSRIFLSNILKECKRNCSVERGRDIYVKTTVNSQSLVLDWTTDESYTLNITTTAKGTFVKIKAETVYGARHGLETLSNLITGSIINGLLMVREAYVQDRPVFPHRGLLLDTSRNFIPLRFIRSTLDAMAASKLNVFHWHVVDSHSFPLEITRVPEMQRYGAYSPDQVYSSADTKNLVNYARLRGIRVIIEIDGPSHAGNGWQWGPDAGLGNMAVCINQRPWRSYCIQPPCGQLNPLNENMYHILSEIYSDVAEDSAPEETMHMGGDEVYIPCWNNTKEITDKMRSIGFDLSLKSFYHLWSDFHKRNLDAWDNINQKQYPYISEPKSVIVWSSHLTDPEIIEEHLPKERFIIQTWVPSTETLNDDLLAKGYRIIISTKNAWYLDHGFWGRTAYYNWMTVYSNPIDTKKNILGGEVCMWSEYVDQNSIESRIWPRAGAAAERLWANPNNTPLMVQNRFFRYRERLIARGIRPDAVIPKWCVLNEGACA